MKEICEPALKRPTSKSEMTFKCGIPSAEHILSQIHKSVHKSQIFSVAVASCLRSVILLFMDDNSLTQVKGEMFYHAAGVLLLLSSLKYVKCV